jgi:hypothetical protein
MALSERACEGVVVQGGTGDRSGNTPFDSLRLLLSQPEYSIPTWINHSEPPGMADPNVE